MSYLVRKISRAKWPNEPSINNFDICDLKADAISSCLRTQKNTLSTWEIDSLENIDEAVLALVSGAEHIDTIFVVSIEKKLLSDYGLQIEETTGNTPILDLKDTHKDVSGLTYQSIGSFARCIVESLNQTTSFTYTKARLKLLLLNAINSGRLDATQLNEKLRSNLKIS